MASSSKTFLLLGFMFALVILISSEVSARELAEITPGTGGKGPAIKCGRGKPYSKCLPGHGPPAPGQGNYEKPGPGVAETEIGN